MDRSRVSAFTLVELLVVVAIIVVLLALLAPALDRAVYEAELAICAARVRGIAEGATMYASERKRAYPNRQLRKEPWRPTKLWHANGSNPYYDERPLIRPYVASINKQFQCPFLPEMDVDREDVATRSAGEVGWASYQFWYGWQYKGEKGMFRLGDRFGYTASGRETLFDVIANDYDLVSVPGSQAGFDNTAIGSHPDKEPRQSMGISIANNEPTVEGVEFAGRNVHIWSRWQGPYQRGLIDMNFAHADNSVNRYRDVLLEREPVNHTPDERMVRVPEGNVDNWPGWRNHLPRAD